MRTHVQQLRQLEVDVELKNTLFTILPVVLRPSLHGEGCDTREAKEYRMLLLERRLLQEL